MTTTTTKPQLALDDSFDALFPPRAHTVPAPGWTIIADGPRFCASHIATKIADWYATKEAAIQATWDTHIAPGALLCRACEQRGVDAGAPVLICADCRADLAKARQRAQQRLDDAAAAFEAELDAWTAYQDALPADTQAKWFSAQETKIALELKLNKALRGSYKASATADERQRIIDACRKNLDDFLAKVERTRRAPQHPLCAVLAREAQYQQALERANAETMAATIALQDIEAAPEGDAL